MLKFEIRDNNKLPIIATMEADVKFPEKNIQFIRQVTVWSRPIYRLKYESRCWNLFIFKSRHTSGQTLPHPLIRRDGGRALEGANEEWRSHVDT